MTFNPNTPLDPGQVSDRRGMGGRGGLAIGGGGIGLIMLLAYTLLGGNPNDLGPLLEPGAVQGPGGSAIATDCKTGQDANERDDCRILGYVNSVQKYWTEEFQASGLTYQPVDTILFSRSPGAAAAPPRLPAARSIARSTSSSTSTSPSSMSCARASAPQGGSLAQGYVIAHEYGHHVQDLLGALQAGSGDTGPQSRAVRTELQADCYAGVWANHAAATKFLEPLTDAQIQDALDAARAVGDDRIQESTTGQVDPDGWTHGSSEQRQTWFKTGYTVWRPVDLRHLQGRRSDTAPAAPRRRT